MAKRSIPEIKERIGHIINAIDEIFLFTEDMTYETFKDDRKTRLAVEKLFEIIGEASFKINKDFKRRYADVEWKEMEGTRHILVHNYYEVIPKVLWDVKEVYLLDLSKKLKSIYQEI
jgi:uncharacterized protein with HEPN domain